MRKKRILFLLPLLLSLTGCTIDLSSDDFTSKLIPNWVSFVTQLGALVVLVTVVIIFGYKPIKKIIAKRQDYIEQNIRDAEQAKQPGKKTKRNQKKQSLLVVGRRLISLPKQKRPHKKRKQKS